MKNIFPVLFLCYMSFTPFLFNSFAQNKKSIERKSTISNISKALYSALPNHVELTEKSFSLAVEAGFSDTSGITSNEILERLKAGVFSEDYENIPGVVGQHFPDPWNDVPVYDFNGLYPITTIPFGSIIDTLSGWYRGLPHGYDPVKGFIWPGAKMTTLEWADTAVNAFTWNHAIELYKTGKKAEAYECLGHILHLLEDLSVPAHVKVVNHGISIDTLRSGTIINPDLLNLIVDEYEQALAGGITYQNTITLIPDLHDDFLKALDSAKSQNIPAFSSWKDYLINLAVYTYNDETVNQFYKGPGANGEWGNVKDKNGNIVQPVKYGITPVSQIGGRWTQINVMSTAKIPDGAFIPKSAMIKMCGNLVPKAAEYGAGLIMYFNKIANETDTVAAVNDNTNNPINFKLYQNYPNPFNPTTNFKFQIAKGGLVTLRVYNVLGEEVASIINKELPAGNYKYQWNAGSLASGVYFYRITAQGSVGKRFTSVKKLVLMK